MFRFHRKLWLQSLEQRSVPNSTPHVLANGAFTQNWTDTTLIGVSDNWDNVPAIIGYRGDGLVGATGVDPQTVLADGTTTPVDVNANQSDPNTFGTGGVTEFQITNPSVALQGSGTGKAPFILINLDTTSVANVNVKYTLRDLDTNTDNAIQPIALHYRIGNTGTWTNVGSAFIADASQGPSVAGPDIPINVTLPGDAGNQSLVQVRIMTTDAVGNDEWIGIDDIEISEVIAGNNVAPTNVLPGPQTVTQDKTLTLSSSTSNAISVTDPDVGTGDLKINLKASDGKLSLGGTTGLTFSLGDGTDDTEMTFTGTLNSINTALDNAVYSPSTGFVGSASITIISDDQGNTGAGGAKTDTDNLKVSVVPPLPPLYHVLKNGPLTLDWSNTGLITTDNVWDYVTGIRGYRGDGLAASGNDPQLIVADGSLTPMNVIANQSNPDGLITGGIAEFDGIANPIVALQGSGTADAPQLVLHLDTTGTTGVRLKFNAVDVDGSADNAIQKVAVQWRVGSTGNFTNVSTAYIADATDPGTGKTTAVDVTFPITVANQLEVQIRILTVDAVGSDEWVGIDDIEVSEAIVNPNQPPLNKVPSTQFVDANSKLTFSSTSLNGISTDDPDAGSGLMKVNLKVLNGTISLSGTANLTFATGDGTDDAEMTFTGALVDINAALENSSYTPTLGFNGTDTYTITTDDQGNAGGPAQMDSDSFSITINPIFEGSYHNLFAGPLTQDWTNTGLISADDDWSMVPSIIGFRGDNLTLALGADPQLVTANGNPPVIDVNANKADPNTFTTGGVAEFDTLANPAVGIQGSGTAAAPSLNFYLNTLNVTSILVQYDLVDLDGSGDNAVQPVALQYRIGTSGPFINVPGGFIADATDGPDLAGKVTAVSATLPVDAEGHAKVQVRVITTNSVGSDEWVGVDNIHISAIPSGGTPAKISKVQTNDSAIQRSMVTKLTVSFDQIVSFTGPAESAFSLVRQGTSAPVTLSASVDNSGTGSVVTLTFTGGSVNGASLADGFYTLKVLALQIGGTGLDGDGNGAGGDDYQLTGDTTNKLFRLFGDGDGNASVNSTDFALFRTFFGIAGPAFDSDGNGVVNSDDFAEFRKRFGLTLMP